MPEFTTEFEPPDPVDGLEIEAVLEESKVRLTWSPTLIAEVDFDAYRVYRAIDGVDFVLLATLTDDTDVDYDDFTAPLNSDLTYRVTQANLDFESEPVEAAISLESLKWWAVTPGDSSLTFAISKVRAAGLTSPKVQELYSPIGRPTRVAVGDVVQTEEGSLSFLVMPDEPGQVALLKRLQAQMEGVLLLKSPDGVLHEVQYGSMTRAFTNIPGMQEITLPFYGVG